METPSHILQKYWGHDNFRELQEDIIQQTYQGKDVIALLPTGGGKSLCFQIPALMKPGICLVISPLVALMEDQVNNLNKKGIKALSITGGLPFSEVDDLLDNCIYGNYKFLYLSPERLQQELVQERIKQMNINLIAVDEAHCISQWGHDFRPSYRNIDLLRELHPDVNFIALTATATTEVVKDIAEQLRFKDPLIFKKSFERSNISYEVLKVEDKYYHLEKILRQQPGSSIIYVRSRKATVEVSTLLQRKGITSEVYHGGLTKKERSKALEEWLSGEKRVMVATNAFGMGIDKPDVRSVVHLQLPESLESYFQEAGRAGRDEAPARAVILTSKNDVGQVRTQFLSALPDLGYVKLVYRKLVTYFGIAYGEGENTRHSFNFAEFCQIYELNFQKAYNSLVLLDRTSVLQLSEQFRKKTLLHVLSSGKQVQYYLEANPQSEDLMKTILRTYGGVFEALTEINLQVVKSKSGIEIGDMLKLLNQMVRDGVIDFEHDAHDASVTFLVPREDEVTINRLAPFLRQQTRTKTSKVEAVVSYVKNEQSCRSQQLLEYFGDKKASPCGVCSVCTRTSLPLTKTLAKEIYAAIVNLLMNGPHSSRELVEKLEYSEEHVLQVLQLLVEKDALASPAPNVYKLRHL